MYCNNIRASLFDFSDFLCSTQHYADKNRRKQGVQTPVRTSLRSDHKSIDFFFGFRWIAEHENTTQPTSHL